jgi:hypothetical protein
MEKSQAERLIKRVEKGAPGWEDAIETLFVNMTKRQQQKILSTVGREIKGYVKAVPDPSPEQVKKFYRFLCALHARKCFLVEPQESKQKNALLKRLS